jgi:hypothetical protein
MAGGRLTSPLKFLLLFIIIGLSHKSFAQKITASFNNKTLTNTLNSLSSRYNLKIAFDTQLADKTVINKSVSNASIDDALLALLEGTDLNMRRMGDVYMIIKNAPKPIEETKKEVPAPQKKNSYYVSGIIRDKLSGESLPYATVYLSKNHIGMPANSDGFFTFETNSPDSVYFVISYVGYQPLAMSAQPKITPKTQTIFVEPQTIKEVIVKDKAEVFDNSGANVEKLKFNPSKLNNIPSIVELDITTPLQMLPSINATGENSGGLSIRKSAPDKTLIIYDGFTIYHMNHFFGAFSSINTKTVKDIQIYKSGFGANYGGSSSGIIEITGKSGNMQKTVVDVGIDMLAVDGKVEIPVVKDKCSFIFAGRRSFTDKLQTPLYTSMFENARYDFNSYYRVPPAAFKSDSKNPKYYYDDVYSKLAIKISENNNLSASIFSSYDNLHFNQSEAFPKILENTDWGTKGASLRWTSNISKKWNLEFIAGASKTMFNYDFTDSIQRTRNRLRLPGQITFYVIRKNKIDSWMQNGNLTLNNNISLSNKLKIETGIALQNFNSLYNYSKESYINNLAVTDTLKDYNNKARLRSIWLQFNISGEKWALKPGIRFNNYNLINRSYPELRLSSIYKLNDKILFKAAAGNYFQFVNKINLVKKGDYRSAWVISDGKKIPVVASASASLGMNINVSSTFNIDIEGFYKSMFNQISSFQEYRASQNSAKIVEATYRYNSNIKGIDFLARETVGPYQLWLSYTLSKSLSISKNTSNPIKYPSDDDQPHEAKVLNMYKLHSWVFSLSGIYGSGIVWDQYILDENLRLSPSYTKNGAQVPAYLRIDGGVNYSFKIKGTELKIGSNFYNLLNRKNVIQKFDKLSETPLQDVNQGINPLEETSVKGLGFSYNFFLNFIF